MPRVAVGCLCLHLWRLCAQGLRCSSINPAVSTSEDSAHKACAARESILLFRMNCFTSSANLACRGSLLDVSMVRLASLMRPNLLVRHLCLFSSPASPCSCVCSARPLLRVRTADFLLMNWLTSCAANSLRPFNKNPMRAQARAQCSQR